MTILKEHVSYSEIRQWKECPWRHKLLYIDKLSTFEESPHLHYGTIIHDGCEHFLKTKELKDRGRDLDIQDLNHYAETRPSYIYRRAYFEVS